MTDTKTNTPPAWAVEAENKIWKRYIEGKVKTYTGIQRDDIARIIAEASPIGEAVEVLEEITDIVSYANNVVDWPYPILNQMDRTTVLLAKLRRKT